MSSSLSPATRALHTDSEFRTDGAVAPPLCQSVTYTADSSEAFAEKAVEPLNGEFYGRHGNPTSNRLAKVIADLEGAETGLVLSSGMAAITTTILTLAKQGDHVIAQDFHYSATSNFLRKFLSRFGVEVTFVDQTKPDDFATAIQSNTKLIIIETPVNPTGTITDLSAVSKIAKAAGITTLCDNTFASPINQRPLAYGIDLSVHSTTKYIGGHHDLLGGIVVGRTEAIAAIWDTSMDLGPTGAPFDSWLALRGVRTLSARIAIHNNNAFEVAQFLQDHPKIERVHYPGLSSHPQHALAKSQMLGFGGMLSFDLKGGYDAGRRLMSNTKLCLNAASLGGVDTLITQPAAMFRARLSDAQIRRQGVTPGMLRLSVGIEESIDLINDLTQALTD